MSALFAEIRLDGAPAGDLSPLFQASAEPPGDGDTVRSWGWAALGCRAFWSTPEEIGERQPLVDPSGRFALLFDGRLDNRDELVHDLGLPGEEAARTSDAALVLRFLAGGRWDALERFIGPWALLLLDLQDRAAHLARDPTGERMLCWHPTSARLLIASEPAALLADPGVPRDFNEETLAAFFAADQPAPEATFFRAVRQVPAGCRVTLSAGAERRHAFWQPDLRMLRPRSEAESVERFRALLDTAVGAQLRAPGPAAVLMSGGLDSTSVAAHAAREQARRGGPAVRAVSWRFQELAAADESAFAQAMMTAAGLEPAWIDGDGCWPLRDLDESTTERSLPFDNPYRRLHAAAFSAAAESSRALLTGHSSDEMYHGVDAWWLRDALARGDWTAAAEGVRDELRYRSRPDVWTPGWRRPLAVLLLGAAGERLRPRRPPAWLTPSARGVLRQRPAPLPALSSARRPEQAATLLAPFALMGIAAEMRRARQHGVELRLPFRDRRMIELALRLPADHLARPGWRKRLVWLAAEGWLPDAVRLRRQMSDLGPLFARGIGEREQEAVRRLLFGPGPQLWRRWIEPAALEGFLGSAGAGAPGLPTLIFWRCLAAELWARAWHAA